MSKFCPYFNYDNLTIFNKPCLTSFLLLVLVQMTSRKRRASTSRPQEPYDTTWFVSEVAWERYEQNIHAMNILLERNVEMQITQYDEFHKELKRHWWSRALTRQISLLFSWWFFWLFTNSYCSWGSSKDHIHLSLWHLSYDVSVKYLITWFVAIQKPPVFISKSNLNFSVS